MKCIVKSQKVTDFEYYLYDDELKGFYFESIEIKVDSKDVFKALCEYCNKVKYKGITRRLTDDYNYVEHNELIFRMLLKGATVSIFANKQRCKVVIDNISIEKLNKVVNKCCRYYLDVYPKYFPSTYYKQ